jgi:hypothetical protein
MPRLKKEKIGEVAVDSGTIVIIDPGYIKSKSRLMKAITKSTGMHGRVVAAGTSGTAVWSRSGGGDGTYPVYAFKNEDGLVKRITIEF